MRPVYSRRLVRVTLSAMSKPPDGAFENGPAPAKPELDILRCARCGAPLRVNDAPRVRCAACGEERDVPDLHRRAVRLTKRADAELHRAGQIWLELQSSTLSRFARAAPPEP